jgi:hypothetical protein
MPSRPVRLATGSIFPESDPRDLCLPSRPVTVSGASVEARAFLAFVTVPLATRLPCRSPGISLVVLGDTPSGRHIGLPAIA